MRQTSSMRSMIAAVLICLVVTVPRAASATIVEIETSIGTFDVNLYDLGTPDTVANFLAYVNNGAYNSSIIHRLAPGFVVQGGGFVTDANATISSIAQNAPVRNEPTYANVRGTIAMAKLASGPDTATSQWFFNLGNNAANLDNQNGGFTVFGQVTGSGMTVVDAIAALPTYNKGGAFSEIPLQNYTAGDAVVYANLVVVTAITIKDTTVDSAGLAGLSRPLSTASSGGGGNGGGGGGGGGGSLGVPCLLLLLGHAFLGRRRQQGRY
jgi:cyclophilin family peptidyl-prolyl cis-trans isomerase